MAMTASAVGHQVKERASTAATQEDAIADEPSAGVPSLEGQSPGGSGIGICCSGGGIRSAAFNLGALQALSAAGVYQQVDFVTCVSGGSYIAASFATVAHGPRFDGEHADVVCPQAPDYAYAPQSPEEQRLRNQSHYLFPRLAVTVRGVIWMLFGLLANLGLLLVFVFVGARPLGWSLRAFGIVPGRGAAPRSVRARAPDRAAPVAVAGQRARGRGGRAADAAVDRRRGPAGLWLRRDPVHRRSARRVHRYQDVHRYQPEQPAPVLPRAARQRLHRPA